MPWPLQTTPPDEGHVFSHPKPANPDVQSQAFAPKSHVPRAVQNWSTAFVNGFTGVPSASTAPSHAAHWTGSAPAGVNCSHGDVDSHMLSGDVPDKHFPDAKSQPGERKKKEEEEEGGKKVGEVER